jgi:hypothetical protein
MARCGGRVERVQEAEEHSRIGVWSRHLDMESEGEGVWGAAEVVAAAAIRSDKIRTCHHPFSPRSPGT